MNKNWNKKKVKYARWWNKLYLKKVRCRITNFRTKKKILWKATWLKKEIELRILAKEKINETERLTERAENNRDELLNYLLDGRKFFLKLLTDLEYEKHDRLNDIAVLESKSIKLKISPARIDRIKISVLLS